jgi:hypothetical protein
MDVSGLFILVGMVSVAAWGSLRQARRLRKAVFFFRSSSAAPEPKS